MKAILTLPILIFFVFSGQSQIECEFIKLCSQAQVDSFPKKFGHCDKIFSIEIDDNCNWVYNLDSLQGLTILGELRIMRMDSLESISGLYNLKKIGKLRIIQRRYYEPFTSLDTITHLTHFFTNNQMDLGLYANIKHIDSSISVVNNGYLKGLPEYTCRNNFNISVNENKYKNDIKNIIPVNGKFVNEFFITRNENLSLIGVEKISNIKRLRIVENKSCNFRPLSEILSIERFEFGVENFDNNEYGVFNKILDLKLLSIFEIENFKNINVLFPNLKKVSLGIALRANKHLVDIKILDSFNLPNLPLKEVFDPKQRILITDNPFLADCISPYICKALETYPDSVTIQNNGPNCEKDQLLHDCLTSSDQEKLPQTISFFPNPVSDKLYWNEEETIQNLNILDLTGNVLYSFNRPSSGLDITTLPSGVYFVRIQSHGRLFTYRICVAR